MRVNGKRKEAVDKDYTDSRTLVMYILNRSMRRLRLMEKFGGILDTHYCEKKRFECEFAIRQVLPEAERMGFDEDKLKMYRKAAGI